VKSAMIEEIATDLYRMEIPLPENPLKWVNSYVIKVPGRSLVIDTGMDQEACLKAMQTGLERLGIDSKEIDIFVTHFHIDHIGLVSKLKAKESILYLGRSEAESLRLMKSGEHWQNMIHFTMMNGFPEDELQRAFRNHPGFSSVIEGVSSFRTLEDGHDLSYGAYRFKCVETPGHSRGHMCLYEPTRKILLSGDHILNDISPTIQLRTAEGNPLQEYLKSLDKVYGLEVDLVLPGHRNPFKNLKKRINELRHHHQNRAEEILSALEGKKRNAYQVASRISWDIPIDSWDSFPVIQKWFAVGEVMAHLKYLEEEGRVRKEIGEQGIVYFL
jgi:glyoxylase-like metal-dependent hydrolase (beta-lactamase superfamily II)